jgi:predicted nucleotidyltransferase/biotin operon repressor
MSVVELFANETAPPICVIAPNRIVSDMAGQEITVCIDAYPGPNTDIFRISAADDILRLLADAHDTEFSIPELVDATDVTRSTVWRAVDLLDSIGAIQIRETPQRNYVAINPDRLQKDDPILAIPQSEFHTPIRAFVDRVETMTADTSDIDDLLGIVVFGSVARGEADRQSDIDCFVVVDGDRTTARRQITDLVAELQSERFDGDRFEFEPYVESAESAERAASKLREIFAEGITVYGGDRLDALRKEVVAGE